MRQSCSCGGSSRREPAAPQLIDPKRLSHLPRLLLKAPVQLYRWTLKPLIGQQCRHMPSCSEYALDAIELNGAWRGLWLMISRILRCRPGGTSGWDPAPDIRDRHHWLMPWRYGRWR
ncbi:MAG: membrane protein insertion efficiency factor YidD [Hyphomicrobiaceae bacterium]|nr:membrane protein insertion efficiency factor YidD [Hyphomicrobiaceae bacterium]